MARIVKRLSEFNKIHSGKKVIVCGCGKSLFLLKDCHTDFLTIGVNDVPKLFTPTYLVITDHSQRFALPRRKLINESKSKAMFTCVKGWRSPNMVMFELGSRKIHNLDNENKVDHFMNSPYAAVGITYKLGFTNIGLIGVDFTKDHFYAKDGHHPLIRMRRVGKVDDAYGVLKDELKKRKVNLYNLSDQSVLKKIPKMSLEDFRKL